MDYQTFKTRKDALAEIEKMRGWDAKPKQLFLPGDENANRNDNAWVIQCDGNKYLRKNGYVR